jgi:nucleoside-diphosphate-sugar epimerase
VRDSGLPFTIVRPPVVYGPRDAQLLRLFRLARLGVVPLLGDGRQELSLVHARDLAAALAAVAGADACVGRTYHAAHDEVLDQRALATLVADACGRRVLQVPLPQAAVRAVLRATGAAARLAGVPTLLGPDKAPEFLAEAWTCSSDAIARDAGWRAATAHADGLRETAAWYRAQGWL